MQNKQKVIFSMDDHGQILIDRTSEIMEEIKKSKFKPTLSNEQIKARLQFNNNDD